MCVAECFYFSITFVLQQYSNNTSPLSSAPQSPTSSCNSISSNNHHQPYNSSNDYYTQAQQTLEQHFEQIRMVSLKL